MTDDSENDLSGTDADTDEAESSRSRRHDRAVFAIGVFVLAAAAAYWIVYFHRPAMEVLESRVDAAEAADARLDERITAAETLNLEVSAAHDAMRTELAMLRQAQSSVEDSVAALFAKESDESLSWILAEAEYLVLAATQRLALEHDVRTAVAALKAADLRLRSAEHPELIPVREQIAKDIAALEAVNLPDVEGLAIYLAEAVARVDQLPTKPIADLDMSFTRMRGAEATPENWRGVAKAMWADLVSLIEIKDGELPDGVLFDPELRYFLQQNLRLELASARLSVLQRDTANYRAASQLILDLLNQYYDTSEASVASLAERLEAAQSIDLAPEIPGITASLDTVRAKRLSSQARADRGVAARR